MRIERLSSTHFRNLEHDPITFSSGVNLFVGHNGHGKTNVLEALSFFQFGRSFRASRDVELIRFGEEYCRIEVRAIAATGDIDDFAASIERNGTKRIKVGGKDVGKYSEMVGRYPCVLFGPHDLALVSGFPAERRRLLDMVGSVVDPGYLDDLRSYRRVLTQRNAALKAGRRSEAQGVWTEELIHRGSVLAARRAALVEALREALAPHAVTMEATFDIDITYHSELFSGLPPKVTIEEQFAAKLAAREADEARRGVTLVGPHRDDVQILGDGKDLRRYGSQGQRRLVAVLLRLAELSTVERSLKEPCVLLLDDLFSELDGEVSDRLRHLVSTDRQVFVTTPVPIEWEGSSGQQRFTVRGGVVTPV